MPLPPWSTLSALLNSSNCVPVPGATLRAPWGPERLEVYGYDRLLDNYETAAGISGYRRTPKSFLFIRYEDLHQDPRDILGKVLEFIGEASRAENLLDNSIEYCSFNNLKKLESQNKLKSGILKPANTDDPESFKVRKGKIGGYTEYLSAADVVFIDKAIADHHFDFSKFMKS